MWINNLILKQTENSGSGIFKKKKKAIAVYLCGSEIVK